MAHDACFLSALELLALYRRLELSPLEATRAVIERIAQLNPRVNALYHVDFERALAAARSAETRWLKRAPKGLLDGVPVTVKDSIYVAGMPTFHGTRACADLPNPRQDCPASARLREHGAVLLGKSTMPDLGVIASGVSSLYGVTRNPWNLQRSSGGSSSGAGAALAAGFGPLALGSDIGGSVRIPAAFCGVAALKPSFGRVPLLEPWTGLVVGPMARTVADTALLLNVISAPDDKDYTALPWEGRDFLERLDDDVQGLKLGLLTDIGFGLPVTPDVRMRVEAAAVVLASLGATVEAMPAIFDEDPEPHFDRMMKACASYEFHLLDADAQEAVPPEIREWCRSGASMSAADLTRAQFGIGELRRRVLNACRAYDYVLAPTMPVTAYAADLPWPPGGTRHNPFCFPFNLSQQPALSVCCGLSSQGLPVGMQIIGKRFDDAGVLRVGRAYEAARPRLPRPPALDSLVRITVDEPA